MKRRDILKMAPAALAASAVPVAALSVADPGETPVMRLYREWLVVSKACDTAGREQPETPEGNAIYEALAHGGLFVPAVTAFVSSVAR